jgi:hypothetical protein
LKEMPVRPFLAGRAFEPEMIEEMSVALERACDTLRLRVIDDAMVRLVAETIIQLAQRGVRGADQLHAMALHQLKTSDLPGN